MPPAPDLPSSYLEPVSLRRRAISFVLAVGVTLVLILMLLQLSSEILRAPPPERTPITVDLLPSPAPSPTPERSATKATQARGRKAPKPPVPHSVTIPPPPVPPPPLNMIVMSRDDFAAADISKLPTRPVESGGGAETSGAGRGSDSAVASGKGPGGETLYNAEWYREPTDAELGGYLKGGAPPGAWAMIACRTVANFRVEDCVEVGQSPPASGLSGAIRQAAWQFRVRPPRVGGKPLIGAWVRIRIDFTRGPDR